MLRADVHLAISLPETSLNVNLLVAIARQLVARIAGAVMSQMLLQAQERMLNRVLGPPWSRQPQEIAPWRCPKCQSNHGFHRRGSRGRKRLRTGVGDVEFDLLQVTCQKCGATFSPFVHLLGLARWQQSTPEVQAQVVARTLDQPYNKSVRESDSSLASPFSAMTAYRWVQTGGAQVQIKPEAELEGATFLFDGTKVKAGDNPRGVAMHLGIAVTGREQHHGRPQLQIKPLAFGVRQPWEDTLAKLSDLKPDRILYDGDEALRDELHRLFPEAKFQRCLWHLSRNLYWALYRDGWQKKPIEGWQKAVNRLIHYPDLSPKEAIRCLRKMIAQLRRRGGEHGAAYLESALEEVFTYRLHPEGFFHERENQALGQAMIATSPLERQMRELNRRTDVGARWSISGLRHLLGLRLVFAFDPVQWHRLWNLPNAIPWLTEVHFQVEVRFIQNVNSL